MEHSTKIKRKHFISISVSILIVLLVLGGIVLINYHRTINKYAAVEGFLDLGTWKMDEENIRLDGQWEFYPGVFLEPGGISPHVAEEYKEAKKYIDVPGSWDAYLGAGASAEGAGTYRLVIRVPEDRLYALKTRTIRLASKVYLNGEKIIQTGRPALNRDNYEAESKYRVGAGPSSDNELELLVHVASYGYRSGGIISPIEFGPFESIMRRNNVSRALDAIAISVCMIISLYFFITYLHRKQDIYLLYFSAASFFMAFYLSTMNEQLLDLIYDYDFPTRTRLQLVGMILTAVSLLQFAHNFFSQYSRPKTVQAITTANLFLLFFLIVGLEKWLQLSMTPFQTSLIAAYMLCYVYVFYILLKAIYHRADFLEYTLIITTSLISYWFALALKILLELDLGIIPMTLTLLMFLSGAALMSHRLQQDYKEANTLAEKLLRSDRQKNEFLLRASHELKTPLHTILNLTQNLFEGQKGTLTPEQQEDLFFLHQEGQRLTRIVADLLTASQMEGENIKISTTALKPHRILNYVLKEIEVLIPPGKDISLNNKIPEDFPSLEADPDKFTQIIYNLIHNAIKYTDRGEIAVSAELVEDRAELRVSDTGVGIAAEHLSEIFTTFYKGEVPNIPNSGLGLGLSIVKKLVESQGGQVGVESVVGQGTSFKFTLPLSPIDAKGEAGLRQEQDPSTILRPPPAVKLVQADSPDAPHILVVDDEPLNQKILLDALEPLGYKVSLAQSGGQALKMLDNEKIDLIIIDFMLPDKTGDEVCAQIRQMYSLTELPVLILTAASGTIDLMKGFQCGANDFQRKPLDVREIIPRVQSLLLLRKTVEAGLKKEFQYFYSQISPHFLYNTINTIIGLSYKDSQKTRQALNNLAIYFRGKLDLHRQKGLVPLESELELLTAYLEIEQLRYGERLEVQYDIDEGVQALLPPLTLQPIIENSIRHGIMAQKNSGLVKISARRGPAGFVSISIRDDGLGMSLEKQQELLSGKGHRLGFKNVLEKIKVLPGADLTLKSEVGLGTEVKILIPEVRHYEGSTDR